jgi:hypothetical protein
MNTNPKLIAPCGMNCGLCYAYLRDKNKCPGCRSGGSPNSNYIKKCIIRNCDILKKKKFKFCSNKCENFPCKRLRNLDKRYRTKYKMSMVKNLEFIMDKGIKKFLIEQDKKWSCPKCGKKICVHKGYCIFCKKK